MKTQPKLISPTQAEKLVGKDKKDELEQLWEKGPVGKPVLVPADSPKPAINMADQFED